MLRRNDRDSLSLRAGVARDGACNCPGPAVRRELSGMKMGSANDMKAAKATYDSFIGMVKWSVPVIAALVALVVLLIQ